MAAIKPPAYHDLAITDLKPSALQQPIFFIKKNLTFYPSELSDELDAPQYVFASNLGVELWYNAPGLGADEGTREKMPRAFFEFKRCDGNNTNR